MNRELPVAATPPVPATMSPSYPIVTHSTGRIPADFRASAHLHCSRPRANKSWCEEPCHESFPALQTYAILYDGTGPDRKEVKRSAAFIHCHSLKCQGIATLMAEQSLGYRTEYPDDLGRVGKEIEHPVQLLPKEMSELKHFHQRARAEARRQEEREAATRKPKKLRTLGEVLSDGTTQSAAAAG